MTKVIIDYDLFKNVLHDYFADGLINEIIDCMNDNGVFISNIKFDVVCDDNSVPFPESCVACENKKRPCTMAEMQDYNIPRILRECEYARLHLELEEKKENNEDTINDLKANGFDIL